MSNQPPLEENEKSQRFNKAMDSIGGDMAKLVDQSRVEEDVEAGFKKMTSMSASVSGMWSGGREKAYSYNTNILGPGAQITARMICDLIENSRPAGSMNTTWIEPERSTLSSWDAAPTDRRVYFSTSEERFEYMVQYAERVAWMLKEQPQAQEQMFFVLQLSAQMEHVFAKDVPPQNTRRGELPAYTKVIPAFDYDLLQGTVTGRVSVQTNDPRLMKKLEDMGLEPRAISGFQTSNMEHAVGGVTAQVPNDRLAELAEFLKSQGRGLTGGNLLLP